MPEFTWEARTRTGEMRKGTMDAPSDTEVMARLRAQQLSPVKVKKKAKELHLKIGTGVTIKDMIIFSRQFATMIDAGLPLVQILDILSTQSENASFRKILADVKTSVEGGASFSESLKRHPKVFDELICNLVAAGEAAGILDTIMNRIAVHVEKKARLARQIKGALAYPTVILCVLIGMLVVMLGYIVPVFADMFASFGAADALPAPTQFVIALSHGFVQRFPFIAVGAIIIVTLSILTYRNPRGRFVIHSAMLTLPIFGPVFRKIAVARFTRTLGTLLASGVPILDALEIVSKTAGNVVIERAIRHARDKISEGKNMAEPLLESKVFPGMVVQMIGVGEQTGALDQMCNKIADFYEEEVDTAVAALTSMLEPLMMVVVGGVAGGILVAMYLPIFNIAGAVEGNQGG
jgi:type IV pilus assembly protein PilC